MGLLADNLKGLAPMDAYDFQAWLAPLLFALLPIVLVAIIVVPGLGQMKLAGGTIAGLLLLALPFVGTRIARAAGRARQDALFASWGGMPSTAMLRYRDTRLNPQTKQIYRDRLARLGNAFPIPTEEDERADPARADINIAAAVGEVRERAKRQNVKSVHRENINFGAARNAYGLKPFGVALTLVSFVLLVGIIALRHTFEPQPLELLVAVVITIIAGSWAFVCTAQTVKQHGEGYALALFEAINLVVPETTRRRPSR